MDSDLILFATSVQEDVGTDSAGSDQSGNSRPEVLTRIFIDDLSDNGELENGEVAHYSSGRMMVSGYGLSEAGDRLDLFITHHTNTVPPVNVPQSDVTRLFRQVTTFLERAISEKKPLRQSMEPAFPGHDMAVQIHEHRKLLTRVRLHLFTDGLVREQSLNDVLLGSIPVSHHVWDIQRLFRSQAHLHQPQPIVIDFQKKYGQSIPCLEMPSSTEEYGACLTILPGTVLALIYGEYGPRLLERNVRSFLQATGGINKGIRNTLLKEPDRFLAYNNGISATASRIDYVRLADGRRAINTIYDFQIVNGGQTTASLHRAMVRDKAELGQVYVQAKISIVNHEQMTEMVPLISRYANSQNRIEEADLAANSSFHVELQNASHRTWTGGAGVQQTQWFYERARGGYRDAEARETTPARKAKFRALYPATQKITKVDVARYINTWMGLPDVVSRGNQKNFSALTLSLTSMGGAVADRTLYQHLVALALLFREAVTLARVYPAYRANIVAYTVAWLAEATARRLDLDRIWKEQKVPAELIQMMALIMSGIQEGIVVGSDRMNVTEWCKKPDAWQQIRHLDLLPVNALANLTTWEPIVLLRTRPVNESPVSEDDDPEQDISEQSMDTEESEHPVARA